MVMTLWYITCLNIWAWECHLQLCLNKINKWTTQNGFKFSKDKTKCMHSCQLRKMHDHPTLQLNNYTILVVDQYNYLGITFNRNLTVLSHIKYLWSKCNKALQLLQVIAHTNWRAVKQLLLKLYCTLVRSKLDYGCFI